MLVLFNSTREGMPSLLSSVKHASNGMLQQIVNKMNLIDGVVCRHVCILDIMPGIADCQSSTLGQTMRVVPQTRHRAAVVCGDCIRRSICRA